MMRIYMWKIINFTLMKKHVSMNDNILIVRRENTLLNCKRKYCFINQLNKCTT